MTILRNLLAVGVIAMVALIASPAHAQGKSHKAEVCREGKDKSEKVCVTGVATRVDESSHADVMLETTSNSKKEEMVIWTIVAAEGSSSQGAITVKPGHQKHRIAGHYVSYGPISNLSLKFAF